MLTVITIQSRAGGTGKTCIGLSAAAQLAAVGRKVAFIELDAQGAHLGQCLPLGGVAVPDGEHLKFQCEDTSCSPSISYRDRPYLFWWLAGNPKARGRKALQSGQRLVVSKVDKQRASNKGLSRLLETMIEHLTIFPASCYVSDIDEVNGMVLDRDHQRSYKNFLTNLTEVLLEEKYEFVFVDNAPGLSFNGGMSISWTTQFSRSPQHNVQVWIWAITRESWCEPGLLVYELNAFEKIRTPVFPVLVVNRTPHPKWLGCFERGMTTNIRDLCDRARTDQQAQNRLSELQSLFLDVPLWLGAGRNTEDLFRDFVLPSNFRIAVVGEDPTIASVAVMEYSVESKENPTDEICTALEGDGVRRWGRRTEEFVAQFFLPAISKCNSTGGVVDRYPTGFHGEVWSALVKPLLEK
ncbi:MAG: hypothetical protein A3B74_04415 [Candidatus Kerfeldbacteria bacterium RIFCSPHIGHO2_02_FULL_42_14]|uniref:Uncharacterized protein n=1 Tax=Candidatus Kerfeldbacteria bacterium RIFCSPHIGHO2_02_FULL_42_14 TaxID=1798540 RepID=A0A1G2ARI0_9BACT|nr:MAG: hypothetical protein A3B74_04415 [Candidatus Kerfeldbacteria bacterium RIFCSPHIGHO2_02_FULL_42_14]OGY80820.1 MAG: hypothetical protein A3E60_01405 [Candidatus Kerfeldbacteria bacterium RIFCSPHIGHO2_12_FULL_42_13]OGY84992.1 MAG: hypothetical protein A3I91_00740 [Candidatus Kerfeldbacteria bacterium RIFCSPLOWO2_02_FULL_42_19]OGY86159.1 MAG: hypothetical protein A3G01_02275 [Candidatus Kerfeldbacteria bacterium RIFCSPLOWO2_12_FULL_43_9]